MANTIPNTMNNGNRLYSDLVDASTFFIALEVLKLELAKNPSPVGRIAPITIATKAKPTTMTIIPPTSPELIPLRSWSSIRCML